MTVVRRGETNWWLPDDGSSRDTYLPLTGHEDEELRYLLDAHLPMPDCAFIDVGANAGTYCIALAGSFRHVYAVDPDPYNVDVLTMNVLINGLRNVSVLAAAAWDTDRTLHLGLLQPGSHPHGLPTEESNATSFTHCSGFQLDHLAYERVGLLKVDVEGCGDHVLRGALEMLRRSRPLIQFEIHGDVERAALHSIMSELAYDILKTSHEREYWSPRT